MDRLPCELLQHILQYIDQPLDLSRMFYACNRWRCLIMNDEYFLNQWFSRSLKRSIESSHYTCFGNPTNWKQEAILDMDKSFFPINLQSSKCYFLPMSVSRHSFHNEYPFKHYYSSSLFNSSHSISFWLFLPSQCELNMQIGSFNVKSLVIVLCGNKKYHFDNRKYVSIADRWICIVLTKIGLWSNYQICIDGQYVSKVKQYSKFFNNMDETDSWINIAILYKFHSSPIGPPNQVRLADLNTFKRCLTLAEIRAIHQQQALIEQTKVGTYINSNKKYTI
ncbi:unnamed protein product [Rotaria sp. Silwood2]|nr:unnamed protein product [Rotaria sp. Silwood2]CAF4565528.1 unnamed protein product [Rotaria sp. Silwood2]